MFDRADIREQVTPAACVDLIEQLRASGPLETVALMVADQPGLELQPIVDALKSSPVPVIGGVFPALIFGKTVRQQGVLGLAFSGRTRRLVLCDLRQIGAQLEHAVSSLFLGPREEDGHTLFTWVDGQVPGIASPLLEALQLHFQFRADFIGGGTGYADLGSRPSLFTEREVLPLGSALVLRIDRPTSVHVEHGWSRLAGPYFVSRAHETTVLELDWRPAITVYQEALADLIELPINADHFSLYPLAVLKLRDSLVVRDPMAVTAEGGLYTLGQIPQHSVVVVLRSEADNLLNAASRVARAARRSIDDSHGGGQRSVFVADCVSRTKALGARFPEELGRIADETGATVAGALTLGEIASRGQRFVDFFNKTVVVGVR